MPAGFGPTDSASARRGAGRILGRWLGCLLRSFLVLPRGKSVARRGDRLLRESSSRASSGSGFEVASFEVARSSRSPATLQAPGDPLESTSRSYKIAVAKEAAKIECARFECARFEVKTGKRGSFAGDVVGDRQTSRARSGEPRQSPAPSDEKPGPGGVLRVARPVSPRTRRRLATRDPPRTGDRGGAPFPTQNSRQAVARRVRCW